MRRPMIKPTDHSVSQTLETPEKRPLLNSPNQFTSTHPPRSTHPPIHPSLPLWPYPVARYEILNSTYGPWGLRDINPPSDTRTSNRQWSDVTGLGLAA